MKTGKSTNLQWTQQVLGHLLDVDSKQHAGEDLAHRAFMMLTGQPLKSAGDYWNHAIGVKEHRDALYAVYILSSEARDEQELRQIVKTGKQAVIDYRNSARSLKRLPIKPMYLEESILRHRRMITDGHIDEMVQKAITEVEENEDPATSEDAKNLLTEVIIEYVVEERSPSSEPMRELFNWMEKSPERALRVFQLYNADIQQNPNFIGTLLAYCQADKQGFLEIATEFARTESKTTAQVLIDLLIVSPESREFLGENELKEAFELLKATNPEDQKRIYAMMAQHHLIAGAYAECAKTARGTPSQYSAAVLNDKQLPEILKKSPIDARAYLTRLAQNNNVKAESITATNGTPHETHPQQTETYTNTNGKQLSFSALEEALLQNTGEILSELGQGRRIKEIMQMPQYALKFAQDVTELKRHPILTEILKAPPLWKTYKTWRATTEEPLITAICHINPFENQATQLNQLRQYMEQNPAGML